MALAHGARVVTGPEAALADHPVLDHVAVLVADHAHVVVTVDAGRIERARQRLPHVHVGDGRQSPRGTGTCWRCPANARRGAPAWLSPMTGSFSTPGLGQAEVDVLAVPVALGEAEEVRPVVHAVVRDEQVRHRRRVVPGRPRNESGRRLRRAVTVEPLVRPREQVVAARARRPIAGRARDLGVDPGGRSDRVVPDRRQRRSVRS